MIFKTQPLHTASKTQYVSRTAMFASKSIQISRALSYSVQFASLKVEIIYAKLPVGWPKCSGSGSREVVQWLVWMAVWFCALHVFLLMQPVNAIRHSIPSVLTFSFLSSLFSSHRLPKEQWWMQLRPLLRILARYEDAYFCQEDNGTSTNRSQCTIS